MTPLDANVIRIVVSEQFKGSSPAAVRAWPVRDMVHALLVVEMAHEQAREREQEAERRRSAGAAK